LEAEDGNNNDVKILSVQKASPDNKYSTLIKPTEKISIQSLITANTGRQVQLHCGYGNTLVGRIKDVSHGIEDKDKTDTEFSTKNDSFVIIEKKSPQW